MTIDDIKNYLNDFNISLDKNVYNIIDEYRKQAISCQDEDNANYYWCLRQVFKIQELFLSMYDSLQNGKYEEAWNLLERTDIELSFLEGNFNENYTIENDLYHLAFIKNIIKYYEKLFPYFLFSSREGIIKKERCSICGQIITLRNNCNHKVGKLYMGEMCSRNVEEYELLSISIVNDPFDKYAVLHPEGKEYNYSMLEFLIEQLDSPYDPWFIKESQVVLPEYKNISRNDRCPCGSGKKYKKCCINTDRIYTTHYEILLLGHPAKKTHELQFMSSWK